MHESESHSVVSDSLRPCGLWPLRLLCPWNSPSQNTGMGSCSLPQGIFPTQGSNPGLPHCRQILYCLSHRGSPDACIVKTITVTITITVKTITITDELTFLS